MRTGLKLHAGDFAENILTEGIDSQAFTGRYGAPRGKMQVTQIGKECHNDSKSAVWTGMCVMPTDGIFFLRSC